MASKLFSLKKRVLLVANVPDHEVKDYYIDQLRRELDDTGIVNVESGADYFGFTAPPFRWAGGGFELFNLVSKARVDIRHNGRLLYLEYRFWFTELFLLAVVLSGPAAMSAIVQETWWTVGILALAWLGAFVGGMVYTLVRFDQWVEGRLDRLIIQHIEKQGDPRLTELVRAKLKLRRR